MLNSPFDKIYSTYYQVLHSSVLLLRRSRFLDKSQVVPRVFLFCSSSIFAITDKDLLFVQTLSWGFVLASVPVAYCHFRHVLVRKFNTLSSNYQ